MADLPTIVVTGAAGFLGRRLVLRLRASYRVIAVDWHARPQPDVDVHENVRWINLDVADDDAVRELLGQVKREGGADALVHLAAFYDFTGEEHPEYQRTNVGATRILLERSTELGLKRFIFASSVAACDFNEPGRPITEETPPLGRHIYSRTKAEGEKMLREFSNRVPSVAIRFGAIFSDWCEYPPLYEFLKTWLSRRWNSRVLGGRGQSTIPFLHARDAVRFVLRVVERRERLDPFEVVIASRDGSVSHRQLFEAATNYYFSEPRRPILVPRPLCRPGIVARDLLGRALGRRPFERPWMADAIDRRLDVDASRTRRRLNWSPQERLDILKRVPFMVENLRSDPVEWLRRNVEAMEHHTLQPNLQVCRLIEKHESAICDAYAAAVRDSDVGGALQRYRALGPDEDAWHNRLALRSLIQAIRTGERKGFMVFCRDLAGRRMEQGFRSEELIAGLRALERACLEVIGADPDAASLARPLREYVQIAIEFGADQVLETYDDAEFGAARLG